MINVSARLSDLTARGIESPMASVTHPYTILNSLLNTMNGAGKESRGYCFIQPMDTSLEGGAGSKEKLLNVLQGNKRCGTDQTTELSDRLLKKDLADSYVKKRLEKHGVDTTGSSEVIARLVNKVCDSPAPIHFDLLMDRVVGEIKKGFKTVQEIFEQLPLQDLERAAEFQKCPAQSAEDLARLLFPSDPQARAGALTDEGQRKTIANQQTNTLGPSGVMAADEMSVDVDDNERVQFLHNVQRAGSAVAVSAVSKIRRSPVATAMVVGGTVLTGAVCLVYDKLKASPPPTSDAAPDVTPPAVTDVAREPDGQQSVNGTSKTEDFHHKARPNTGYQYSESAEEEYRRHETSEVQVLKRHPKKIAPPHPPS